MDHNLFCFVFCVDLTMLARRIMVLEYHLHLAACSCHAMLATRSPLCVAWTCLGATSGRVSHTNSSTRKREQRRSISSIRSEHPSNKWKVGGSSPPWIRFFRFALLMCLHVCVLNKSKPCKACRNIAVLQYCNSTRTHASAAMSATLLFTLYTLAIANK